MILWNQSKLNYQDNFDHLSPLTFSSHFPGGNLYAVYQISNYEYDLVLENDTNTNSYTQWFYFSISQTKTNQTIQLNFINLTKNYYQFGDIKPLIYYSKSQTLWKPFGSNFYFTKSNCIKNNKRLNYLTFSFQFQFDNETAYIALNTPYQLSDLQKFISKFDYTIPCHTIARNPIYQIQFSQEKKKEVIIIIARQHPGETVSSFVFEGLINFISSNKELQDQYQIIAIPCVNPDGVITGNFRCDLTGVDLNRVWNRPSHYKQISYIKKLVNNLIKQGKDITFFIDLHGHSKKYGAFIYGCRNEQDPLSCRVIPSIMSRISSYFSFNDCTFNIYQKNTARACIFKLLEHFRPQKFHNVFTLETSFFGYRNQGKIIQFTQEDLLKLGEQLGQSILEYSRKQLTQQIIEQLEKQKEQFQEQDLKNKGYSDSEPEQGYLTKKQQIKCELIKQDEEEEQCQKERKKCLEKVREERSINEDKNKRKDSKGERRFSEQEKKKKTNKQSYLIKLQNLNINKKEQREKKESFFQKLIKRKQLKVKKKLQGTDNNILEMTKFESNKENFKDHLKGKQFQKHGLQINYVTEPNQSNENIIDTIQQIQQRTRNFSQQLPAVQNKNQKMSKQLYSQGNPNVDSNFYIFAHSIQNSQQQDQRFLFPEGIKVKRKNTYMNYDLFKRKDQEREKNYSEDETLLRIQKRVQEEIKERQHNLAFYDCKKIYLCKIYLNQLYLASKYPYQLDKKIINPIFKTENEQFSRK